ncbi:ABC transporter substrate-binding protein [Kaustia mangrovi]|uniref:ABC transporter substrate-binding protein n=1 Tax=Kaustia mangrovi TaxID=2593653 RepID=A0A7S8C2V2_9HYPH|nr:ABC transporter substrate-binding protein [Kaustia mangrovi]QPC42355.1 ABC transporter substrate-binding protein [Kaustia mangrovi]
MTVKSLLIAAAASLALAVPSALADDTTGLTKDTIKVGVPGPFTGDASSYSKAEIGLDAFYRHINDEGGIHGRKIEVIKADTACNEARGIAAAKKLIHQDEVFMIHGNSCSGVALAMKPTIEEAGVPWMIAHAVADKLSTPVVKTIFHGVPTSRDAGTFMAKYAMSRPDTKRIAIVAHSNEWAQSYRRPLVESLDEDHGIEPVLDMTMERGSTDATPQILKIRQADVDFVMAILYEAETAIFLRDAQKYGLDVTILGGYGTDLENTLKRVGDKDAVKNYQVLHMFQNVLGEGDLKTWGDVIHKYYPDEKLTAFSFAGIGSAIAMAKALEAAGPDLTREKLVAELDKIRDLDTGVLASDVTFTPEDHAGAKDSGVAAFDENGDIVIYRSWGQPF